ncbi:hypothetical protein L484_016024 [Morus notabilis]|uniref:Uncharacterized protein n=1 Tax=Morus notabilis TaxID=981085 RepID=W9R7F4_9ROSA|nr:hypothetical protein L484_016024 [Morus notabilis]
MSVFLLLAPRCGSFLGPEFDGDIPLAFGSGPRNSGLDFPVMDLVGEGCVLLVWSRGWVFGKAIVGGSRRYNYGTPSMTISAPYRLLLPSPLGAQCAVALKLVGLLVEGFYVQ